MQAAILAHLLVEQYNSLTSNGRSCCLQAALGETWVLYDVGVLASMLICLITYSVFIHSLVDFQPQDTYEVYDSLGGAQARLLLPKKASNTTYNGELSCRSDYPCCQNRTIGHQDSNSTSVYTDY